MKKIKCILVAFGLMLCSHAAIGQTSVSAYFLDGMFHNHRLNPAMKAERAFFSLPVGNVSFRTKGNVGISNFLFPRGDNELATFMSGSVTKEEFLDKLPDFSNFGLNFDESLLACGFRAFGGYASIEVTMHSSLSMSLPKGLFEFAKKGFQENSYDIGGIGFNTMNYASVALGYSHEVIEGLRVGGTLKYLMGLAHADFSVDRLKVEMNDKHWLVEAQAQAQAALFCESNAVLDDEGLLDGVEFGSMSPSASGFAVDLGVTYDMEQFVPGLKFSASLLDLGFIKWKHTMMGQSAGSQVEFTGFGDMDHNDMGSTIEDELENFGDDVADMFEFKYNGTQATTTNLSSTMYLGAEYNMPFYQPLSVALLYGQRFSSLQSNKWYDVRGFVNVSPTSWFEASVNFGANSYGTSFGWLINLHPGGFNFFLGSDHMITNVTPQFIPVNDLSSHFTFGVNIPIGSVK